MKLSLETAKGIKPGDYIILHLGGKKGTVEGAIRKIDPKQGLIIDRPDGSCRVHGPSIFKCGVPVTYPKEHPVMVEDPHTGTYKVE